MTLKDIENAFKAYTPHAESELFNFNEILEVMEPLLLNKKFEYTEIYSYPDFKTLGLQGWELCGMEKGTYFFKREL